MRPALAAAEAVAEEGGYALDAPAETSQRVVVAGEKLVGSRPILLGLTLSDTTQSSTTGVDGPALLTSLTLGHARS